MEFPDEETMSPYNPSYSGGGDKRIKVWEQAQAKKLMRPYFIKQAGVMAHICNPNYKGGRGRRIMVQVNPRQKHESSSEK
jgi:hypothetical protein